MEVTVVGTAAGVAAAGGAATAAAGGVSGGAALSGGSAGSPDMAISAAAAGAESNEIGLKWHGPATSGAVCPQFGGETWVGCGNEFFVY